MDNKIKHLEMIQGLINRMSSNSFMLKGWVVTLLTGFFAIANDNTDETLFLVIYIPIMLFWFFDSYYLWQEKLYRYLYNETRAKNEGDIDFSLCTEGIKRKVDSYLLCLISGTEFFFYIPLAFLYTVIVLVSYIL